MTQEPTAGAPLKLPIVETGVATVRAVLSNPIALLRLHWAWMLVLLIGVCLFVGIAVRTRGSRGPSSSDFFEDPLFVAAAVVALLFYMVMIPSIAVGWHRYQLLGETPPVPFLRIDGIVWRYLGLEFHVAILPWAIVISVVPWALAGLAGPLEDGAMPSATPVWQAELAWSVASFVYGGLATRLCLGLPGRAIGAPMAIRQSWAATRGNTIRLIALMACLFLPFHVASIAIDHYLPHSSEFGITRIGQRLVAEFVYLELYCVLEVSLLTEVYRRVVRRA